MTYLHGEIILHLCFIYSCLQACDISVTDDTLTITSVFNYQHQLCQQKRSSEVNNGCNTECEDARVCRTGGCRRYNLPFKRQWLVYVFTQHGTASRISLNFKYQNKRWCWCWWVMPVTTRLLAHFTWSLPRPDSPLMKPCLNSLDSYFIWISPNGTHSPPRRPKEQSIMLVHSTNNCAGPSQVWGPQSHL